MNLILLFKEDFINDTRVRLLNRRRDHIVSVLKSKIGDMLNIGLCDGQIGQGTIVTIAEAIELDVQFNQAPPKALPLTLILALPRPHLFKRSLFFAAMLGIKNIHILNFNRVEKSLWNSSTLRPEVMNEQLVLGLEQAKDTVLPTVHIHDQFKPFVQDALPGIIKGTTAIVADPSGQPVENTPFKAPMTLVIGPEGGIIPYELDMLQQTGFKKVNFGDRILRVDACLPFITAKLGI